MKTMISFCAVVTVALALLIGSAIGQDVSKLKYPPLGQIPVPKTEKITLDNGLRLYLLEDHSLPTLHASARINCGSYLEPPAKAGLAEVCGSVLRTGGTDKYTGDQIDELLESIGASVETNIGTTSGSASMFCLSEYADTGLQVLAQVLRYPKFAEDKIELTKVMERSGISRRNDDPEEIGSREFGKLIYGAESPYARQVEYKTINAISRDDLVKFHQAFFHPENVQIAVWGDFNRDQMLAKIKELFGDWQKTDSKVPPPPKVEYKFDKGVWYVQKNDINQSKIYIGHIGGLLSDPDYPARIVMNYILGGGWASRLFNNVRSKEGLAYAVDGRYSSNIAFPGIFYGYVSTKSETTGKAVKSVMEQIKSMQTVPPTADEMNAAKDAYANGFVFRFDNRAEIINRLMTYDFYGLPENYLFQERDRVQAVTPADVVAAAKANLHPEALKVLIVGKGSDFDMPLAQLDNGAVDTVDITIPAAEDAPALSVTPENLDKGKAILAKAVTAHGGAAVFKKIKSISERGTFTINTPQGDMPVSIENAIQFPDKVRVVQSLMGMKMVDVRNGGTGWRTDMRTGQLVEKGADDIAKDQADLARNPIWVIKEGTTAGLQPVFAGSGQVEGAKADFIWIIDKDGKQIVRLGFDPESGRLVSREYRGQGPMGEGNMREIYANYKDVSGLKWPMSVTQSMDGQKIGGLVITEFTVNTPLPAGAFDKPQI